SDVLDADVYVVFRWPLTGPVERISVRVSQPDLHVSIECVGVLTTKPVRAKVAKGGRWVSELRIPIVRGERNLGTSRELMPYPSDRRVRSEEHTSELQSPYDLVCRLLLEKKKKRIKNERANTGT